MQISRGQRHLLSFAIMFMVFMAAIMYGDLCQRHDASKLPLHISLLLNFVLVTGLLSWFGERWKYFNLASLIMFIVITAYYPIHSLYGWIQYLVLSAKYPNHSLHMELFGNIVVQSILPIFGVFRLKQEFTKLKSLHKPQQIGSPRQEESNFR